MSILRRFLGLHKPSIDIDPHLQEKYRETSSQLTIARANFRQSVQNVDSGTRTMLTWDEAMRLATRNHNES